MNNQSLLFSSASTRTKPLILLLLFISISLGLMLGCNNKVDRPDSALEEQGRLTDLSMAKSEWNIAIKDAWARPTKAGMMSAAYFTIHNVGSVPDSLVQVSSSASEDVQIHLSYMNDGIMVMEEQPFVAIQASEQIPFQPGGYHIMIIQPTNDMEEGDSISLSLYFKSGMIIEETIQVGNPTM
ncbi:MAG: Uncharacterised protein [Rhodothermaeota bacterium MED-G12]|mgnify:FL=1|nr:MAG: Uncharacterised protein [Rhodothermaeota bacterium MED-G12]